MLPHILQLNGKTPALKCRAPHVLNRYSCLTLIWTQKKKDISSRTDHDTRCLQLSMVSFGALLPLAALQKAAASPHPHTAYPGYARLLCSGIEQIGMLLWLETFAFLKLHFLERRRKHTCCRSTSEFKTELPAPLSHLQPPCRVFAPFCCLELSFRLYRYIYTHPRSPSTNTCPHLELPHNLQVSFPHTQEPWRAASFSSPLYADSPD